MSILVGALLALPGGLAVLAGLSGVRRARRLRRDGVSAWAMAVPPLASAGEQPGGSPHRTLIQYQLADGRVVERISPEPARKTASLHPGQKILIWYDPDDPQDVLVYGREGRLADWAFVVVGVLFIVVGTGIAMFIR
jgi:hypothetical protein